VPNAAPQVAHSLGATRAGAIDIGAACTGFVSGLSVATAMLESGRADHVLLIGAEILSRHLDVDDRRTAGLFGDGAGAALVSAGAPGSIGPVVLESDGALSELIAADPVTDLLTMDGHETFKRAIAAFTDVVRRAVQRSGLELDDVDRFVLHQANGRILLAVGEALGVAPERMVDAIADVGNTSAASIPLALCAAQPRPGERLVLAAVGAGFTWGACVVEWGDA
jgi:3-oxoacyl-[acyl-carrier-protein] synthase-3